MKSDTIYLFGLVTLLVLAGLSFRLLLDQEDEAPPVGNTSFSVEPVVTAEAEIVAADQLSGRVCDEAGDPVAAARVMLFLDVSNSRDDSILGALVSATTTDAKGAYRFSGIPTDEQHVIRIEAADFARKQESLGDIDVDGNRSRDFRLERGLDLRGCVLDDSGRAIVSARLIVMDRVQLAQDPQMAIEKSCMTDANGAFHCVSLNPGVKRVTAQAEGFGTQTKLEVPILVGEEFEPVEFRLAPGGVKFQGRVVDAGDDLPIPGVLVRALPMSSGRRVIPYWHYPPVATDEDGIFTFLGLMPGSYRFRAFGPKGYPTLGREITAIVSRTEDVVIELQRGPSVMGRVVDGITGDPVERFKITFSFSEHNLMNAPSLTQRFDDPMGEFEYQGIQISPQKKEFWLHAVAKGYAGGTSAMLTTDGKTDIEGIEIVMDKGATVVGRILDSDGKPIRGAQVELSRQWRPPGNSGASLFNAMISNGMRSDARRRGRTDEKGAYRIEQVPTGWFKVKVDHASYADAESEQAYRFDRDGTVELAAMTLVGGGGVTGRVLDENGRVDLRAKVQLRAGMGRSYIAATDSAGRFEFRKVRPGDYVVIVMERRGQPDIEAILRASDSGQAQVEVRVDEGRTREIGDLKP